MDPTDTPSPTVSACIPSQGRSSLVEVSIPSLLAQGDGLQEVVVALHGVAAPDHPVLRDPRVRVIRHDGPTVSTARNAAAEQASGDLLYFLDDDDRCEPGGLDALRALVDRPQVALACGAMDIHQPAPAQIERRFPSDQGGLYHHLVALFHAGTFAVRRSLFEELGGYRGELRFGENYELGLRLAHHLHDHGLAARTTDHVVLAYDRHPKDRQVEQARTAALLLELHPDLMAANPDEWATHEAIVAVAAWREGRHGEARRRFARAVRLDPRHRTHWARMGLALVPPVADRRWPPA